MWPMAESHDIAGSIASSDVLNDGFLHTPRAVSLFHAGSFVKLLRHSLRLPASIVIASFSINLLGLALPLIVVQIFDRVLKHQSLNTLTLLLVGLILALIAETILRLARNKLIGHVALQESFYLHMHVAAGFMNAPRAITSKLSPSAASDAMTAVDEMTQFLGGNARLALLDFPFVIIFLGLIAAIGGSIVIVPAFLIALFTGWTIWSSAAIKAVLRKQVKLEHERFTFYTECLKGIATVKSFAVEPQMLRRFETILQSGAPLSHELVLRTNRMAASGQLFASLTMVSVVSIGGIMAIQGTLSIGALAGCTLIANRVVQPVMRIIAVWGQMEATRLAQERYAPLLELPRTASVTKRADAASVELLNVSMGHGSENSVSSQPGIQLTIQPADVIGIISRDFAQRAQLFGLLRGTVRPHSGSVLIDGTDPASAEGDAIQQGVYSLGSAPVIFRGSILDNISMFRCVSYGSAISTARALGLDGVIQALPNGYDTLLDDIGASALPADILQAICVVRAVVMRPRMLLLDVRRIPPDDVSTRACARAIEELRGSTTIIIFGKYISEMKEADRIFALQGWQLHTIAQRTKGSVSERSRQLIADTLDLNPKA